jgi:hypothetical protein
MVPEISPETNAGCLDISRRLVKILELGTLNIIMSMDPVYMQEETKSSY